VAIAVLQAPGLRKKLCSHLSIHSTQVTPAQQSPMSGHHWGWWLRGLSGPSQDAVAVPVAAAVAGRESEWGSAVHTVLLWGTVCLTPHSCHLVDLHGGLGWVVNVHFHQGGIHGGWAQGLGLEPGNAPPPLSHPLKNSHSPGQVGLDYVSPPNFPPFLSSLLCVYVCIFFFFLVVLEFAVRTSHLLGKCPTA
jgi:hypothetical protein